MIGKIFETLAWLSFGLVVLCVVFVLSVLDEVNAEYRKKKK